MRYHHHSQLQSKLITTLNQWWHSKAGDDVPDRSDFDPVEVRLLLPNLLICDVEHDPFRVRYRLVGTKVVEATGIEFTGRYLDDLVPVDADEPWMDDYRAAYDSRRPVFGVTTLEMGLGGRYIYEFGIMPLRSGGSSIDQFVSIEDYFDFGRLHEELKPWTLKT